MCNQRVTHTLQQPKIKIIVESEWCRKIKRALLCDSTPHGYNSYGAKSQSCIHMRKVQNWNGQPLNFQTQAYMYSKLLNQANLAVW